MSRFTYNLLSIFIRISISAVFGLNYIRLIKMLLVGIKIIFQNTWSCLLTVPDIKYCRTICSPR